MSDLVEQGQGVSPPKTLPPSEEVRKEISKIIDDIQDKKISLVVGVHAICEEVAKETRQATIKEKQEEVLQAIKDFYNGVLEDTNTPINSEEKKIQFDKDIEELNEEIRELLEVTE
jgi:predicted glycosyltransferase